MSFFTLGMARYVKILEMFYNVFQDHIYAFNTDTSIWEDTRIVIYGEVLSLFVDQNDILTIQTVGICSKKSAFYRFSLK